jgi:rare lipoprotein A
VTLAAFVAATAGVALAQSAAPIVYKSSGTSGLAQPRLENRVDSRSLAVAPHAPIPTFANSRVADSAIDLRPGATAATFGPAPMAAAKPEAMPLRTAAVPVRPSAMEQSFVTPYAGPPYQVAGRWYVPAHEPNYDEVGTASWYGPTFHGKAAASGETFNENDLTAAHPTLPIPSLVRVTNLENGRSVVVRLNDRGPFVDDRIIDLSKAAGAALDMHAKGTARVRVQYVGPAPATGGGAVAAVQPQRIGVVSAPLPPVAKPVVAAPAPVAMPASSTTGQFFVQAGSFADLGNAHALRDRLSQSGRVSIEATTVNGSEFYRVMVGPWNSRADADAVRLQFAQAGRQGLVVARGR